MSFEGASEKKLLRDFNLLCGLISQDKNLTGPVPGTDASKVSVDLSRLEEIINKKIPEALSKNAPADYYELYTDFKAEYDKLRDYILYDRLIGKSVVALGGGFSSGKSTFLNMLIGHGDILPTAITPTTAVPTYMVHDTGHSVEAINIFDVKVKFKSLSDIRKVSHAFGHMEEDGNVLAEGTALGQILESIFVATSFQPYKNIAFLDTPGYSKADSETHSARTDEQIARQQLNTANLILWFINSGSGHIGENDIKFLRSLRPGIPMAVILTRAEEAEAKSEGIEAVKKNVRDSLIHNGMDGNCLGIFAYEGSRDSLDAFDMPQIKELVEKWNKEAAEPDFSLNFKRLFIRCRKYCTDELDANGWQLQQLNDAAMHLMHLGENVSSEVERALNRLIDATKRKMTALKKLQATVEQLRKEFFTELKHIGDQVGIRMPEPDDISLLKESSGDPLALLREYNEKKGIRSNPQFMSILQDVLGDVEPQFQQFAGGSEYQSRLLGIMRDNCPVKPKEIRFNDIYLRTEMYRDLVRTLTPRPEHT